MRAFGDYAAADTAYERIEMHVVMSDTAHATLNVFGSSLAVDSLAHGAGV